MIVLMSSHDHTPAKPAGKNNNESAAWPMRSKGIARFQ
jgi:hypothetical protein